SACGSGVRTRVQRADEFFDEFGLQNSVGIQKQDVLGREAPDQFIMGFAKPGIDRQAQEVLDVKRLDDLHRVVRRRVVENVDLKVPECLIAQTLQAGSNIFCAVEGDNVDRDF